MSPRTLKLAALAALGFFTWKYFQGRRTTPAAGAPFNAGDFYGPGF